MYKGTDLCVCVCVCVSVCLCACEHLIGNQKQTCTAAVFEHSEHFLRLYHLRSPKQPAGISRLGFRLGIRLGFNVLLGSLEAGGVHMNYSSHG